MFAHLHSSLFYKRNSVRHHLKDIQHLSHIVLHHKSFPLLNINERKKIANLYLFFVVVVVFCLFFFFIAEGSAQSVERLLDRRAGGFFGFELRDRTNTLVSK